MSDNLREVYGPGESSVAVAARAARDRSEEIASGLPGAIAEGVAEAVPGAVSAAVAVQVGPAVAESIEAQVPPAVASAVEAQVPVAVGDAVASQVPPAVADAVPPAVAAEVLAQVDPKVAQTEAARDVALQAAQDTSSNMDAAPYFTTEADLLAYAPSNGKPAILGVDNGSRKRGVYRRTSGAWPATRESAILGDVDARLVVTEGLIFNSSSDSPYVVQLVSDGDYIHTGLGHRAALLAGVSIQTTDDGATTIRDRQSVPLISSTTAGETLIRGQGIITSDDLQAIDLGVPAIIFEDPHGYLTVFVLDETNGTFRRPGYSSGPQLPPTDIRYYGLRDDPTASLDQSAALKAAHDAAFAAGIRALDFGTLTINAPTLSQVSNVFFIGAKGRGQLIGTAASDAYRKQVLPYGVRPRIPKPRINIKQHWPLFAASSSPKVVTCGDSTLETNQGQIGQRYRDLLHAALVAANPGKTITLISRSVGGQTFATFNSVATANWPTWYANHAAAWIPTYVEPEMPDVVTLVFGENDQDSLTFEMIDTVVNKLLAFATPPNLLFATCLYPSSQTTSQGANTKANQEKRAYAAGMVRTYANRRRYALLDVHQFGAVMHDGIDVVDQALVQTRTNASASLPLTLDECTDYSFACHAGGGFGTIFASSGQWEFPLSGVSGNSLLFRWGASVWEYRIQTSDTRAVVDWTAVSGVSGLSAVTSIAMSVHSDGWLIVSLNGVEQFAGFVDRHGGLFTPVIGKRGGGGSMSIDTVYTGIGEPQLCLPALTDDEMWGQGNGLNHMGERGRRAVYGGAIEATNWGA